MPTKPSTRRDTISSSPPMSLPKASTCTVPTSSSTTTPHGTPPASCNASDVSTVSAPKPNTSTTICSTPHVRATTRYNSTKTPFSNCKASTQPSAKMRRYTPRKKSSDNSRCTTTPSKTTSTRR